MQSRFFVLAFCFLAITRVSAETLRWGFSPTDPAPYVMMQGGELGPSITRSMGELVASRLGWQLEFVEVPNNRLDQSLRGGRIDLVCNTNPAWHRAPEKHRWSRPLYHDADVVVIRAGRTIPDRLEDMEGMRIGAGHDQHYPPELANAFSDGTFQRLDVRDTETRLRMVEHNRLDATVERRRAVQYHITRHPDHLLAIAPWTLAEIPLQCVAEQKHRDRGTRAIETLERLYGDQDIRAVLTGFGLVAEQ
ncbi:substrate-binding periplasmic protein [Halopseudomonas sp.]|uniref:substrate-binding periplasmic protein n=1 Tax=Halopseudomonas sp. TaxID=2901191 RepID=UPI003567D262